MLCHSVSARNGEGNESLRGSWAEGALSSCLVVDGGRIALCVVVRRHVQQNLPCQHKVVVAEDQLAILRTPTRVLRSELRVVIQDRWPVVHEERHGHEQRERSVRSDAIVAADDGIVRHGDVGCPDESLGTTTCKLRYSYTNLKSQTLSAKTPGNVQR